MALLNRRPRCLPGGLLPWLCRRSGVVLAAVLLAGCALFSVFGGERPLAFSHAIHAKEGLECGDCHIDWETEDAPGMPAKPACDLCHDAIDADKPPERKIDVLFDGNVFRAQRVSRLDPEIVFSHRQHATKPIECAECHRGIAQNDVVDAGLALRMADCQSCHQQQSVANECATCHRMLDVGVMPNSHLFQWKLLHGQAVRAHGTATVDNCSLCHTESSCRDCHQVELPENHTNYFRRRGHGIVARMDRQNCAACHRSDSCDTCHQHTRPITHRGSFGGTVSTHCLSCHFPVRSSSCGTCHRETPSHAMATPLPPGHSTAMNCRLCHGAGQPLPHVDKGDDCTICHR